jgi:hypothetical protein
MPLPVTEAREIRAGLTTALETASDARAMLEK